jgi:tetratricopeptide (TPR) repeat protein
LRLSYAFNHPEAIRAFDEAARLDPDCAMCYWGTAYAYGPNINAPMDSAGAVKAYAAMQKALAAAPNASEREQAFIRALATRYTPDPPGDRPALDSAYAEAMAEVVRQYPDDLEAATLHAEAIMNLRPWAYWTLDGQPQPGTTEILSRLEGTIERNPNHPGACHFYIHAVEAAQPEKAVACAERLAGAMPGAGHLVHMPAHIYIRTGRWDDAIEANRHATHADEVFIADQGPSGVYRAMYYPHNYHFLAFAGIMSGRSEMAIESARATAERTPPEAAKGSFLGEPLVVYPHLTLAAFGRWNEVLREPAPPSELQIATALYHYARGLAFSATKQWSEAEASLGRVTESAEVHEEGGETRTILDIARHSLLGDLAARRGNADDAIDHFREAMSLEDGLYYIEPPIWHLPVRHAAGAVLLDAGHAEEAEALYREDLKRFPDNGWSLFGLQQALEAQGRTAEAEEVKNRFAEIWSEADLTLTASRF